VALWEELKHHSERLQWGHRNGIQRWLGNPMKIMGKFWENIFNRDFYGKIHCKWPWKWEYHKKITGKYGKILEKSAGHRGFFSHV